MSFRKVIFWSHLAMGIVSGAVILNMAVTGIILALEPQIVDFSERRVNHVALPAPDAKRLSLNIFMAKTKEAFPNLQVSGFIFDSDPAASIKVTFGKEDPFAFLNPYTGEVIGRGSKIRAMLHWIEEWHRYFASKDVGKPITGAACLIFFLLICSGLFLWWRDGVIFFKKGLLGKARDWNWHNVIGFWALPLLLLTTLTGLVMSYTWANNLLYRATGNIPPVAAEKKTDSTAKKEKPKNVPPSFDLDPIWAVAEKQVPGWKTIALRFPQKSGGPITAWIQESSVLQFNQRSQLVLSATTAEIVKWEPYSDQNLAKKMRSSMVPLHTGRAWGMLGQVVMLLVTCGAVMLVWTGFAMAWRRFFPRK